MTQVPPLDRTPAGALPPDDARAVLPVTLEGRFVRLEPLSLDHVASLARAVSGARETYRWTNVPQGEAAVRVYVEAALDDQLAGRTLPFATIDRAAGQTVGSTRFGNIEYWAWPEGNPNQRGAHLPDAVEIGWTWLAQGAQRTAINTEAKLLMLRHAFETWRSHRVLLKTDERNARSRAAIERIGGKLDGILRAHMPAADGAIRNTAFYSIVEAEWPEVREKLEARLDS